MKPILIKTTETHFYMDPTTGSEVQAFRPSVVSSSNFISMLLAQGKVKLIAADLTAEATDEEYAAFFKESDRNERLANESFLSKFQVKEEVITTTTIEASTVKINLDKVAPEVLKQVGAEIAANKTKPKQV
jgi:hypothetical protein